MMDHASSVVVVIDSVSTYTIRVLEGIRQVLEAADVPLLIHINDYRVAGLPPSLVRSLESGAFRGVISLALSTLEGHERLEELLSSHPELPVVTIGMAAGGLAPVPVTVDNRVGMRELMRHLLDEQGITKVALIRGVPHHPDSIEREGVVREELARRGLELPDELVIDGNFNRRASYQGAAALLQSGAIVEVLVALNDEGAMGGIDAALDIGLRVPEDIAVTGFDDDRSLRSRVPLTTVDQDLLGQGARAAELMLTLFAGTRPRDPMPVHTRLVVRHSSLRNTEHATAQGDHPAAVPVKVSDGDLVRRFGELDLMDSVLSMNRAFMSCSTEHDVLRELIASLPRLEITHCYVVLNEPAPTGPRGRLACAHPPPLRRLDAPDAVTGEPEAQPEPQPGPHVAHEASFPLTSVLPQHLHHELRHGTLLLQSLALAGQDLGYVIYRQRTLSDVTAEVLRMDLTRALDGVARQRHLEQLVTQRTETLNTEIAVRRRAEAELSIANEALRRSVNQDGLTGIANRKAFDEYLHRVWTDHITTGAPLSLVFVDVDHFKLFNDHYGHLRGDEALRAVATALSQAARDTADQVARFGGEEFVVILPRTAQDGALAVSNRIRTLIRVCAIPHAASPVDRYLTVSQCVATTTPTAQTLARDLLDAADSGLYRAKADGRNQIAIAGDILDTTSSADPGRGLQRS